MNRTVFANFRRLIFEHSGIELGLDKDALLASRIAARLRALGLSGPGAYYRHIMADAGGAELGELLNRISTNVTRFFREASHFEFLGRIGAEWARQGRFHVRLWCAACATGEEPYSMAITLREAIRTLPRITIDASDLSTRALEYASAGIYRAPDVAAVSPSLRERYFRRGTGPAAELFRVKSQLRDLVVFSRINLAHPPFAVGPGLDAIFCRNVMIYFSEDLRRRLTGQLHDLLRPGGHLFVGLSESLANKHPGLTMVEPSIYRRD